MDDWLVFGAPGIVLGGVSLFFAFAARAWRKQMSARPRLRCSQAAQSLGPALVEGNAESEAPLLSPISQTPCVYYRVYAREEGSLAESRGMVPFETRWADEWSVADDSGKVRVQADDAELLELLSGGEANEDASASQRVSLSIGGGISEAREELIPIGTKITLVGNIADTDEGLRLICDRDGSVTVGAARRVMGRVLAVEIAAWLGLAAGCVITAVAWLEEHAPHLLPWMR